MNIYSEIINYWGNRNLLKIHNNAMDHLHIPYEAKQYLANVGVIKSSELMKNSLGISFDAIREENVITLASYFNSDLLGNDISESMSSWVLLGHCYDKLVCINIEDSSIVNLEGDPESGFIDWFVNSSISKYFLFVTLVIQSFERGVGDSTIALALQELRRDLSNADPMAMRKSTHWWPIVLNDIQTM